MRLPLAFAAFVLAAAVGYVLLRPRWRWYTLPPVSNAPSVSSSSDPFARPFGETWRS